MGKMVGTMDSMTLMMTILRLLVTLLVRASLFHFFLKIFRSGGLIIPGFDLTHGIYRIKSRKRYLPVESFSPAIDLNELFLYKEEGN